MDSLQNMLEKIVKEISIDDNKYENAKRSYMAVGEYIGNNIEPQYEVRVFPQGSFRLGTVNKPINEEDDYDIDLVSIIGNNTLSPRQLKNIVGQALQKSQRYSNKLTEGRRCWTIEYADSLNYHIDILPAYESSDYNLNKRITITDKLDDGMYIYKSANPEAYFDWFDNAMRLEKDLKLKEYAYKNEISIEDVPRHKVKTTLQSTIQLLKRYRDILFLDNNEVKPISIIITTLVTKCYTGNENIIELIEKFVKEYMNHINRDKDGNYVITNPVNTEENFADKWQIYPERKEAFFRFMEQLDKDIVSNKIFISGSFEDKALEYKRIFGDKAVNRAYEKLGEEMFVNRNKGDLYIDNTSGNISTVKNDNVTRIKQHNFYGK